MTVSVFRLRGQIAHVLPWSEMTGAQQAEHLVHGHGFDTSYWDDEDHPDLDTDAKIVDWYRTHWLAAGRETEHDGDHSDHDHGGSDHCPHVHDKTP